MKSLRFTLLLFVAVLTGCTIPQEKKLEFEGIWKRAFNPFSGTDLLIKSYDDKLTAMGFNGMADSLKELFYIQYISNNLYTIYTRESNYSGEIKQDLFQMKPVLEFKTEDRLYRCKKLEMGFRADIEELPSHEKGYIIFDVRKIYSESEIELWTNNVLKIIH